MNEVYTRVRKQPKRKVQRTYTVKHKTSEGVVDEKFSRLPIARQFGLDVRRIGTFVSLTNQNGTVLCL